jgi:hypothetical protein
MKRLIVVCLAALGVAGFATAQAGTPAPANSRAQTITVSGKLEFIDGTAGLKADGTTYYTPQLLRLSGFIKDLQEGATVKLEGYAYPIPSKQGYSMLMVTTLTINGRDYDLKQDRPFGPRGMMGRGGRMMEDRNREGMWGGPCW